MSNPLLQAESIQNPAPAIEPSLSFKSLRTRLAIRFCIGLTVTAAVLFVPAGTVRFWQAWVFLALMLIPWGFFFFHFLKHDPQLVARRLESKEQVTTQRRLVRWLKQVFFAAAVIPGLDFRLGWSRSLLVSVPLWLSILADALVLAGLLTVVWVLSVNRFAARTIRVETGQRVISSGPYRWVRHPMYTGSVVMWLAMPLALGSFIALPAFAALIPFYVVRLLNEEKVLLRGLPGYAAYCDKTRYHLVPFIW